jgi:hypothetical protein
MAWELVPCLGQLRTEINRVAPDRDKSSDGTIGDTAHQQNVSDHNDDEIGRVPIRDADSRHEVHAYDADVDLRVPGLSMEDVVQHIVARCRSGAEKRLRYLIYNRRIWEASNGWRQRTYSGDNPHDKHAHFSASYETSREADTSSWHLDELIEGSDEMLVKKGDKGEEVRLWQYMLNELGHPVTVDGDYGPATEAAVNASRKAKGQGPAPYVSGWHAFVMLRDLAAKYAGKPGTPGAPGAPGKDAVLTGTLNVTGGQLTVETGS